jgi:hypothetical protein
MYARSKMIGPPPQQVITELLDNVTGGGGTGSLTAVGYTTTGPSGVTITGTDAGGVAYQRNSTAYLAKTTGLASLVYDLVMPSAIDCALFAGWLGAVGNASLRIHNPGAGYVFSHYVDLVDHDFAVIVPVANEIIRVHHDIIPSVGSRMWLENLSIGGREQLADHVPAADTYQFTLGISSGAAAAARSSDFHLRHYSADY